MMIYIGIDNGTTGTIGIAGDDIRGEIYHTPVKKEQDYTKAKKNVSRLDVGGFMEILNRYPHGNIRVVCERPMINPGRWTASMTAIRCWEAQLVTLEVLGLPHIFVDSREWQRQMLPKGIQGASELKKASKDIGLRLFPYLSDFRHTDFDGLLIAEYARRNRL